MSFFYPSIINLLRKRRKKKKKTSKDELLPSLYNTRESELMIIIAFPLLNFLFARYSIHKYHQGIHCGPHRQQRNYHQGTRIPSIHPSSIHYSAIYCAFWAGTEMVVKFHVLPPSGVDMTPPVAPSAQAPVCLKLSSAWLRTTETSSHSVFHQSSAACYKQLSRFRR